MTTVFTLILTVGFFALAMLGLGVGVILKKRTPLKGSCRGPVDGTNMACGECDHHGDSHPTDRDAPVARIEGL